MRASELFDVSGFGVIVTGGASGIGLSFVETMAEAGARVAILDVNQGAIADEVGRLRSAGLDVQGAVVDVADRAGLDAAVADVAARFGRLDVVFANAGVDSGPGFVGGWVGDQRQRNPQGALEAYGDSRWDRVIEVNLNGVFATLRAAARHMKARGFGRMIVTTSAAAIRCEPAIGSAYMAAKAGAAHFVRNVALEMAAYGVTVNAIAPGMFVTNIGGGHLKDEALQAEFAKTIPAHRVGFPSDMRGLALFLASRASDYVTGQQIVIDGGFSLGAAD